MSSITFPVLMSAKCERMIYFTILISFGGRVTNGSAKLSIL